MKFDDLIKQLLEDYNYDFTSGKYSTGTAYASQGTLQNIAMPFPGMGGANEVIGGNMFPQKKNYIRKKKKIKGKYKNERLRKSSKSVSNS